MDGLSRLQGWALFDGMPSPGMDEQGSMLTQLGSPSMNGNHDGHSPVGLDGSGQGQDLLRSFETPSPIGSRPSVGSGGPGSARSRQKQQQMQMGGSPLHPSGMLEPGGGLTNPGPGQFGRGPSPLEGRLGDVVSPPPRMEELSDMMAAASLNGGVSMPPPMLMRGEPAGMLPQRTSVQAQLFSQPDYVSGPTGGGPQSPGMNKWAAVPDMPPKGYKTVICKFWENNMCAKGAACTFAHGQEDLQRFAVGGGSGGLAPSPLKLDRYKTKLCLFHMQGRCCKGPACPYAHGLEELRPAPVGMPSAMGGGMGGMGMGKMGAGLEEMGALSAAEMAEWQLQAQLMGGMLPMGLPQDPPPMAPAGAFTSSAANDDHIPLLGGETGPEYTPSGGGEEEVGGFGGMGGGDELDSAQAVAAARYFQQRPPQQQQQAPLQQQQQPMPLMLHHPHGPPRLPPHLRAPPSMALAQPQAHMPPLTPQQQMLLAQKRGMAPGPNMKGGAGMGGMGGMGYRPVSMWPHGPAWSGEEL